MKKYLKIPCLLKKQTELNEALREKAGDLKIYLTWDYFYGEPAIDFTNFVKIYSTSIPIRFWEEFKSKVDKLINKEEE